MLEPLAFARYAIVFTLILAGAHYLLSRVWVSSYRPARVSRWLWVAATAIMVGTWTLAYPWAAPMFIAYVALQIWVLRRHRDRPGTLDEGAGGRSLLADLDGRFPLRSLWPLAAIPLVAIPTYALLWELALSEEAIRAWMYTVIAVQSLIAIGTVGYAFVRVLRSPTSSDPATPVAPPPPSVRPWARPRRPCRPPWAERIRSPPVRNGERPP